MAARTFQRVSPKLAVSGRVEFGEDLMTVNVGDQITVARFEAGRK